MSNPSTEGTERDLATMERLLVLKIFSPRDAIRAAYNLGKFDGGMEMAKVGTKITEKAIA
jgi:hypothetical protein